MYRINKSIKTMSRDADGQVNAHHFRRCKAAAAAFVISAAVIGSARAATAAAAVADTNHNHANAMMVTADASEALVNQTFGLLENLGVQPSGTIKDTGNAWCIFNNWADRDQRASVEGSYDSRFSSGTTFGGRWYCFLH